MALWEKLFLKQIVSFGIFFFFRQTPRPQVILIAVSLCVIRCCGEKLGVYLTYSDMLVLYSALREIILNYWEKSGKGFAFCWNFLEEKGCFWLAAFPLHCQKKALSSKYMMSFSPCRSSLQPKHYPAVRCGMGRRISPNARCKSPTGNSQSHVSPFCVVSHFVVLCWSI